MSLFGGDSDADRAAKRAERRELERQAEIEKGTNRVRAMFTNQFTPDFYEGIKNDFLGYYKPQLQSQYDDQNRALQFALARSGHLGRSSADAEKFGDLQEQFDLRKIELANRANDAANQRKGQVQGAMENVLLQLQSSADASGAAADAANQIAISQAPVAYDPLGQVFTDATFGLATQADLERRGQSRYNTGLFSKPSSSSGEVVS